MSSIQYPVIHRHKEVPAVICEDCGAIIHYSPTGYKLERLAELMPDLIKKAIAAPKSNVGGDK